MERVASSRSLQHGSIYAAPAHARVGPPRAAGLQRLAQPRPQQRQRVRRQAAVAVSAVQKKAFSSFQDMLTQSPEPALVEFYATWCGPCVMMSNIMNEVAPALRNRVRFIKVDTEKYPVLANQYQIRALPTLILFKDGAPIDRVEGVLGPSDLKSRLEYLLSQHT